MEIRGIFGVAVVRRLFQRFAEVRQAFGRLTGAHRSIPPPLLLDFKEKIPHHNPQINPYGDGNSREAKAPRERVCSTELLPRIRGIKTFIGLIR
jgi:hypothetical protein